MNTSSPGSLTKIGTIIFLLMGSILAYTFIIKIFIHIWNPRTYLFPGFLAMIAGLLIYGGTKQWERWRLPLGVIWIALCALAFFNSLYYLKMSNPSGMPAFTPGVLEGYSNGSIVMGCVAFALGASLIVWQRKLDREAPDSET